MKTYDVHGKNDFAEVFKNWADMDLKKLPMVQNLDHPNIYAGNRHNATKNFDILV